MRFLKNEQPIRLEDSNGFFLGHGWGVGVRMESESQRQPLVRLCETKYGPGVNLFAKRVYRDRKTGQIVVRVAC